MKSSKSNSPTKSPRHNFSREASMDHHADFEMELNRNLGNQAEHSEVGWFLTQLCNASFHVVRRRQELARESRKGA